MLEVATNKLERITKSGDGGKPHLDVGLLLASTLDNGCKDGIGVADQSPSELRVLSLADVTNTCQGRLSCVGGCAIDVCDKSRQEILPLASGQFDGGDRRNDLGRGLASL